MDEDNIFGVFFQSLIFSISILLFSVFINYVLSQFGTCITLQKSKSDLLCEGKIIWQLPIIIALISFTVLFAPKVFNLIIEPNLSDKYKTKKKVNLLPFIPEKYLLKTLISSILIAVIALILAVFLFGV